MYNDKNKSRARLHGMLLTLGILNEACILRFVNLLCILKPERLV